MIVMAEQVRGRPLPKLKAWRIHRLMTQADLAAAAGVGKATIVRAERGDEIVSFANIRKLAETLGISTDELLRADPPQNGAADGE
jgi:transcriptional regulator with XRE-family HTH domain